MKNKFNNITSKEWLPFQKSWFRYESDEALYLQNIRFFSKLENADDCLAYYGPDFKLWKALAEGYGLKAAQLEKLNSPAQFILIDVREELQEMKEPDQYENLRNRLLDLIAKKFSLVVERRFLCVLASNKQHNAAYFPFAWDLAAHIGSILSLKDEKIGCLETEDAIGSRKYFTPGKEVFYSLYFRKDELSGTKTSPVNQDFFSRNKQSGNRKKFEEVIPSWFILKPQPRKKNEVLHPAKYPEELVEMFIRNFSDVGDNVLDPMSGTGSTQMGALKLKRNGFGTELSDFFAQIAHDRCKQLLSAAQADEQVKNTHEFKILNKDARSISKTDFPEIHYMITSPPYWDMLNMRGAENQAKRIGKGLKTNYSDDPDDLGNIAAYQDFLQVLTEIYFNVASLMKPGSYLTIVVKNIKKKGSNYPFAWDLCSLLQEKLILLPEVFWCQDDISIAPYGYGNTWVSNTFHQYCLTFQVPDDFEK